MSVGDNMTKYFKHISLFIGLIAFAMFQYGFYLFGDECNGTFDCRSNTAMTIMYLSIAVLIGTLVLWFKHENPVNEELTELEKLEQPKKLTLRNKLNRSVIIIYFYTILVISVPFAYPRCISYVCTSPAMTMSEIYVSLLSSFALFTALSIIILIIALLIINVKYLIGRYRKKNYINKDF